jgi:hypothetical protein
MLQSFLTCLLLLNETMTLSALTASVAKLVDRGLVPASHVRQFTGVAARLLAGRPAEGGFGTLPWLEHIRARHAWWGTLFATASHDTELPWIRIGRALLRSKQKPFVFCISVCVLLWM